MFLGALLAAMILPVALLMPVADRTALYEDFTEPAPLGSFSACNHNPDTSRAYCGGLAGHYRDQWWAYPDGWPDTSAQRSYPVRGVYDPSGTTWVSDGQLHVRMFTRDGVVHSSALVPKPLMNRTYGKYSERFRVSHVAPGYKSAHLLWGSRHEVDFPENEWNGTIAAYTHPGDAAYDSGAYWSDWHTSEIEWTAASVRFMLDERLIGETTTDVPHEPMTWILQNEAALNGERAADGSWAQIDIDWVSGEW